MLLKMILLAIVQGITEFLPISSSGHLVFFQQVFSITEARMIIDVILHAGTLGSIVIYFRKDLMDLFLPLFNNGIERNGKIKYIMNMCIAIIPAGLAGVFFDDFIETNLFVLWVAAIAWIINGINLLAIDSFKTENREITYKKALIIGLAQMFAIIPGISRSGTTISAGVYAGMEKKESAKFSFLIAIPLIFGATVLKVRDLFNGEYHGSLAILSIGFVVSMLSGIFALHLLYRFLERRQFKYFGIYTILAGAFSLIFLAFF